MLVLAVKWQVLTVQLVFLPVQFVLLLQMASVFVIRHSFTAEILVDVVAEILLMSLELVV